MDSIVTLAQVHLATVPDLVITVTTRVARRASLSMTGTERNDSEGMSHKMVTKGQFSGKNA